jgi:ribA/ribD-fused uncharacterized protein
MSTYVFFWQPPSQDPSPQACLSQWAPSPFEVSGQRYPTAEHWMMAEKARLFGDAEIEAKVLAAKHPKAVKALGRKVRGYENPVWHAERERVVQEGNLHKFRQNPELLEFLLSTGDATLVEASPYDRIWGIGLRADQPAAQDPGQWRGLNLLGKVLMEVRRQLRERSSS